MKFPVTLLPEQTGAQTGARTNHAATSRPSEGSHQRLGWPLGVALLLSVLVLLCWRLGAASLNDWDEAIYAQVAKEIVTGNDWLTLHWGYKPWFHKPPLFMWTTAALFKLFGVSEFWARFPSVLSGVGLIGCTYLIANRLQGAVHGRAVGLIAALVLLTNYTFVHFSRFGTTDMALTFFSYLAIYAYLQVAQQRWAWCGVWGAIAAAAMIKGVAGLGVAIALFLTLLITKRLWQALKCREFWVGIGLAALVVLPWHLAMLTIHGGAFIDQYLLYHVVERSTGGGLEGNEGGPFYYFGVLGKGFFPWVYLLPLALLKQMQTLWQPASKQSPQPSFQRSFQEKSTWILPVFVAVIFGGFSLASTKLPWYIIPIYPALAIWVGSALHKALMGKDRLGWIGLLMSGTAVMALFPADIEFLSASQQQMVAVIGLLALTLLSVAVFEFGWQRQVLSVALCGVFVIAGLREIKGNFNGYEDPVATLSQVAEVPVNSQNPPLLVAKLSERLYIPTPLFYSNRPIGWIRSVADLARATQTDRRQDILLATADVEQLKTTYDIDVYANKGDLIYAGIQKRLARQ
jgi:4-amino-4-deoxy-L-arabinose transferase-like glycosyltransferase